MAMKIQVDDFEVISSQLETFNINATVYIYRWYSIFNLFSKQIIYRVHIKHDEDDVFINIKFTNEADYALFLLYGNNFFYQAFPGSLVTTP